jgi:hypothetical protein
LHGIDRAAEGTEGAGNLVDSANEGVARPLDPASGTSDTIDGS